MDVLSRRLEEKMLFFNCGISDLSHKNNLGPNPDPGAKLPDLDRMNFDPIPVRYALVQTSHHFKNPLLNADSYENQLYSADHNS